MNYQDRLKILKDIPLFETHSLSPPKLFSGRSIVFVLFVATPLLGGSELFAHPHSDPHFWPPTGVVPQLPNPHVQHQCCPRQGACWFIINVTMLRTRWHTSLASVALEILAGSAEGKEGSVNEPNFACKGRWHANKHHWACGAQNLDHSDFFKTYPIFEGR